MSYKTFLSTLNDNLFTELNQNQENNSRFRFRKSLKVFNKNMLMSKPSNSYQHQKLYESLRLSHMVHCLIVCIQCDSDKPDSVDLNCKPEAYAES